MLNVEVKLSCGRLVTFQRSATFFIYQTLSITFDYWNAMERDWSCSFSRKSPCTQHFECKYSSTPHIASSY